MKTYGVLQRGYLIWALLKAEFKKIPYKNHPDVEQKKEIGSTPQNFD